MTKKGETFLEKIKTDSFIKQIEAIAEYYGTESQLRMLAEECVELAKEALKAIRSDYVNTKAIAEEIADVTIMTSQIMHILKIRDIEVAIFEDKKVVRQIERIKEEIGYKDEGAEAEET